MTGLTDIDEDRQHQSSSLNIKLTATQTTGATVDLPADTKVLFMHRESANEAVFGPGVALTGIGGGNVLEVWTAGERVFSTNAQLPGLLRQQQLELSDKIDYTLVAGLNPLVRNTVSTTLSGSTAIAKFSYDKVAIPPMVAPNSGVLARTATPKVSIPVGRYTFPQSNVVLLVYSEHVLWVTLGNGSAFRLRPGIGSNGLPSLFRNAQINATFDTTNNRFFVQTNPQVNVTVTASMRDI
jgi:hypothetical protein